MGSSGSRRKRSPLTLPTLDEICRRNGCSASPRAAADRTRSPPRSPSPPFVIALSGGADSAALAGLVAQGRLLHVHHGQPHSDRLQQAAEAIATVLALPLVVERATVAPWSEEAAQAARYDLLLARLEPQETLLTGHTADDQPKPFSPILRGSGLTEVRESPASAAVSRGRSSKSAGPRLVNSRRWRGLPWQDDPTNDETDALRNRIRHRRYRRWKPTTTLPFARRSSAWPNWRAGETMPRRGVSCSPTAGGFPTRCCGRPVRTRPVGL